MCIPPALQTIAERYFNVFRTLPFNQQLFSGILPSHIFRHYLEQDAFYLAGYTNTLRCMLEKAPDQEARDILSRMIAITAEYEMEQRYKNRFFEAPQVHPITSVLEYTQHLYQSSQQGYDEGIAAIYPCTLLYLRLGYTMPIDNSRPNHPYLETIRTYSEEAYRKMGTEIGTLFQVSFDKADKNTRLRLAGIFCQSLQHECDFHEAVYVLQKEDNNSLIKTPN